MVLVCLPSDALSQHLLFYLGFPYLGWSISSRLLQQSAAAAPYLDKGYLLTAAPPDLECVVAPIDYAKDFDVWITRNCGSFLKRWE